MMKFWQTLVISATLIQLTVSFAQPAFEGDDPIDFKNNAGGAGQGNAGGRVMDTNLIRSAEDLNEQLDIGIVSSEAVADSGPALSSIVNKHMAPANASWVNKTYFGISLKGIQQMLNKYLIANPKLPNWWKQLSESSIQSNNQPK